jgi:hypothetical protein
MIITMQRLFEAIQLSKPYQADSQRHLRIWARPLRSVGLKTRRWSFLTLSLQSVHGRTLTSGCLSGASALFFQESYSLTPLALGSAHPTTAAMQLQRRPLFRVGSSSIMFRLPCLPDPHVVPTAQALPTTGSQGFYVTQWTGSYLP